MSLLLFLWVFYYRWNGKKKEGHVLPFTQDSRLTNRQLFAQRVSFLCLFNSFFYYLFHSYSIGYSFSHRHDSLQTLQETVCATFCYYYYIFVVSIERNVWQDIFPHNRKDRAVFTSVTYYILLYRHECFNGKYTTRKSHKNYIRNPSGLFSIISHVNISMA